jgi:hypothetical protein
MGDIKDDTKTPSVAEQMLVEQQATNRLLMQQCVLLQDLKKMAAFVNADAAVNNENMFKMVRRMEIREQGAQMTALHGWRMNSLSVKRYWAKQGDPLEVGSDPKAPTEYKLDAKKLKTEDDKRVAQAKYMKDWKLKQKEKKIREKNEAKEADAAEAGASRDRALSGRAVSLKEPDQAMIDHQAMALAKIQAENNVPKNGIESATLALATLATNVTDAARDAEQKARDEVAWKLAFPDAVKEKPAEKKDD